MKDFLYRGVIQNLNIRFSYAMTTRLSNEAVLRHQCDPLVSQILCRSLCAGILTSPLLEGDERYTLRWNYQGAVRSVVVDVGADSDARGTCSVKTLHDRVSDEQAIYGDAGSVSVVKSSQKRVLSSGTTEAGLLDVVEDLAFHFSCSDQVETGMRILVGFNPDPEAPVNLCQGFMIQALPDCDLERFEEVRRALRNEAFTRLLGQEPSNDNTFELLVRTLTETPVFSIHECTPPEYRCRCSRDKTRQVLQTLPEADRQDIAARGEALTIRCQFCCRDYTFSASEAASVFAEEA